MNPFFKFLFTIQGYPMKKAAEQLKYVHGLSDDNRLAYQKEKADEIFEFHKENNPHYKKWLKDNVSPKEWSDIPILTKTDLQVPLEERLSNGYTSKNVFLNRTSGSSGKPLYYAKDKFAHAISWSLVNDRFGRHGIRYGSGLQARFYGMPLDGLKYYKERLKDFLARRVRFKVHNMSLEMMDGMQAKFASKKFTYVNGYTTGLVMFARHMIQQNITIKSICPTLEVVLPTSEAMDEEDRKIIKQGFGVPVANEYGASEVDLIAFEDEDIDWIVNNETLLVEVLDDNDEPVPPGVEGRVIITALYNKSMPFIRYEVGDLAMLSAKTKGSYSILEKVAGRISQFAELPSGGRAGGMTFYYIAKSLLSKAEDITEFMIKQTREDEFILEYVAKTELSDAQKDVFRGALDKYLEPGLTAFFEKKEFIERTKSGKLMHFKNMIER